VHVQGTKTVSALNGVAKPTATPEGPAPAAAPVAPVPAAPTWQPPTLPAV